MLLKAMVELHYIEILLGIEALNFYPKKDKIDRN